MAEIYMVERLDEYRVSEIHETVFTDRETAESVRDALNTGIERRTHRPVNLAKWRVWSFPLSEEIQRFAPLLKQQVTGSPYSAQHAPSGVHTVTVVPEGTVTPETEIVEPSVEWPFWNGFVYASTLEELTTKAEKLAQQFNESKG